MSENYERTLSFQKVFTKLKVHQMTFFNYFLPFLCNGVTSLSFKDLRNINDLSTALILLHK